MTAQQEDTERQDFGRPEPRSYGFGPEVGFLPPLPVEIDSPAERQARLAAAVANSVIPKLLQLYQNVDLVPLPSLQKVAREDILELAKLVLGPDNQDAEDYVLRLKDRGLSLDDLHHDLLEPAACHLGELWEEDRIDFVEVSLGVSKLQRLVHVFERLDQLAPYDAKRRVLLTAAPGDQHSFGNLMVQKFLRAAGWHVWTCTTENIEEAADVAAKEWLGVVGFSLSSDVHLDRLKLAVSRVRELSRNRTVGVMVGGSAIARNPSWVVEIGADGTAVNAPAAVILAKKLLVASLAATGA